MDTILLDRKVQERKKFLEKTVDAVIELVQKKGKILKKRSEPWHTNVESELRDFGGFTFFTDLGQTVMGGNTVKVWYHPARKFREGGLDSAWDKEWTPVLAVDFWAKNDYRVIEFNKDARWQNALAIVFNHQDEIAGKIKLQNDLKEDSLKQESEKEKRKAKLVAQARKLGIRVE